MSEIGNHVYEFYMTRSQWYIAPNRKTAVELFLRHNQYKSMAEYRKAEGEAPKVTKLGDSDDMELFFNGDHDDCETRTCGEWAEAYGVGHLCNDVG